jgi:hypothetical protein
MELSIPALVVQEKQGLQKYTGKPDSQITQTCNGNISMQWIFLVSWNL